MAKEQAAGGDQESALPPLSMQFPNLPVQPTPLIGRGYEVEVASALLQRPEVRLLTITGPGGVGKTRLALQLAANLQDAFADGVCFIPLASIQELSALICVPSTVS